MSQDKSEPGSTVKAIGAFSIDGFAQNYDIGKTQTYREIKEGRLRAVKRGRRTLILFPDAVEWQNRLPEYQPDTNSQASQPTSRALNPNNRSRTPLPNTIGRAP